VHGKQNKQGQTKTKKANKMNLHQKKGTNEVPKHHKDYCFIHFLNCTLAAVHFSIDLILACSLLKEKLAMTH